MYEEFFDEIEKDIGKERFEHSLRTADFAVKLARLNGADENKAYVAGLFHDCGKWQNKEKLYEEVKKYEVLSDYLGNKSAKVLHAFFGSIVAKEKYGIENPEILSAIRYHATGRADMTLLEKVVYCADTFEPGRDYEDAKKLREITLLDLDRGLMEGLIFTINNLTKNQDYIDMNTFYAYNYMAKEARDRIGKGRNNY